ncbi:flagellar basal body rod protein FlgB [Dethiosulfovibrio sp. F2B]|uniref:flagellar basal body rod protein FlgB n=1 Tax=Dethiosulfovibrio faecalis TaxID=2720018 RepID=UPI001F183A5D|nr:flagellar basal body rod protein FlgB [Dethiosulfovibrio faecalis]
MFDLTWKVMEKDLQGLAHRFRSVGQNLANTNTPGYARREVSFEDQLDDIINGPKRLPMATTDPKHMSTHARSVEEVTPREDRIPDQLYRLDRNNVDPEIEMAKMAETKMGYDAMTQLVSKKVSGYKTAMGG